MLPNTNLFPVAFFFQIHSTSNFQQQFSTTIFNNNLITTKNTTDFENYSVFINLFERLENIKYVKFESLNL